MQLLVPFPADWVVERRTDGAVARLAGTGVTVNVSEIFTLADDPSRWARDRLREGASANAALRVVSAVDVESVDGWPLTVIHTLTGDAARLHFLFTFIFRGAMVVASSDDAGELERHREAIIDFVGNARPDFSGEVVALRQVWPAAPEPQPGPKEDPS